MAYLRFRWLAIGVAAWLIAQPFDPARAATQALALLETSGATPLTCADGVCRAEFSAFCLQKERPLPKTGAPYTVATGENLHLLLTAPDGAVRRIPAADHIRIYSARAGHTAVVIELPRTVQEALGARHAAIDVGERVTLMPVAMAHDDNPQTEQDKQLATGPLRMLAARLIDRSPDAVATVRILNRLVNTLPQRNGIEPGVRARLWQNAVTRGFAAAPMQKIARAAREYQSCWRERAVALGGIPVRDCLQRRHDGLMWKNVERYWNAAGAGT